MTTPRTGLSVIHVKGESKNAVRPKRRGNNPNHHPRWDSGDSVTEKLLALGKAKIGKDSKILTNDRLAVHSTVVFNNLVLMMLTFMLFGPLFMPF